MKRRLNQSQLKNKRNKHKLVNWSYRYNGSTEYDV